MTLGIREPSDACAGFSDGVNCPDMLLVPPGAFVMGATEDDKFASALERPRHPVTIRTCFAIARVPVTFAQWDAYVADSPGARRPEDGGWGRGALPVINVSWDDVQGYLGWLSRVARQNY